MTIRTMSEQFTIQVAESETEATVARSLFAQANLFAQFAALGERICACGCILERATFTHSRIEMEYDPGTGAAPVPVGTRHLYRMEGLVSGAPEDIADLLLRAGGLV